MSLVHVPPSPRLAVEHAGTGALVLFLHGIGGNRRNWRRQVDAVAAAGFHAAAWDARGYGESEDYEGALEFADFSRDVLRVLDYFGAATAHLVGLSMGGLIAQDFYRQQPQRVRSLVLAGTRNGYARSNAAEFLRRREAPLLAGLSPRDIAAELAPTLASRSAPEPVLAELRESIAALHKESYLKALRTTTRIGELPGYRGRSFYVDLQTVSVPALVLCGTEDSVTPPELSRALAAGIPGAKLQMIESAGHLCNIEQPEDFNAALLQFLKTLR
jgi:3-oxoadipate enol-lactonase